MKWEPKRSFDYQMILIPYILDCFMTHPMSMTTKTTTICPKIGIQHRCHCSCDLSVHCDHECLFFFGISEFRIWFIFSNFAHCIYYHGVIDYAMTAPDYIELDRIIMVVILPIFCFFVKDMCGCDYFQTSPKLEIVNGLQAVTSLCPGAIVTIMGEVYHRQSTV